jgi:hypothetical protein
MKDLEEIIIKHQDGALLNISVISNSESVVFPSDINKWRKSLGIKVISPAKDNRANKDVIEIISNFFRIPLKDVLLISGNKNKNKTILIKGVTKKYIIEKLRESLDGL